MKMSEFSRRMQAYLALFDFLASKLISISNQKKFVSTFNTGMPELLSGFNGSRVAAQVERTTGRID